MGCRTNNSRDNRTAITPDSNNAVVDKDEEYDSNNINNDSLYPEQSFEHNLTEVEKGVWKKTKCSAYSYPYGDQNIQYIYEYCYEVEGNTVKVIILDLSGNIYRSILSEYDNDGNQIKVSMFNKDGSLAAWNDFTYDTNGNRLSTKVYDADGKEEEVSFEYKYDSNNNMIEEKELYQTGKTKTWHQYEYDSNDCMIKEIWLDFKGDVEEQYEYEYDIQGCLVKKTVFNEDGRISYWISYENDLHGNCIKETLISPDGQIKKTSEYVYDTDNHLLEYYTYFGSKLTSHRAYAYDENGNLIRDIRYGSDEEIDEIIEYEWTFIKEMPVIYQ